MNYWYGKKGPKEAATEVASLEAAEEEAVAVAATEEEATRQSPSS